MSCSASIRANVANMKFEQFRRLIAFGMVLCWGFGAEWSWCAAAFWCAQEADNQKNNTVTDRRTIQDGEAEIDPSVGVWSSVEGVCPVLTVLTLLACTTFSILLLLAASGEQEGMFTKGRISYKRNLPTIFVMGMTRPANVTKQQ